MWDLKKLNPWMQSRTVVSVGWGLGDEGHVGQMAQTSGCDGTKLWDLMYNTVWCT